MADIKEYLIIKEVSDKINMSESAIRIAIKQRRIRAYKVGRQYLIHRNDIVGYVPRKRGGKRF